MSLPTHIFIFQYIPEYLKISSFVYSCVFTDFIKIRKNAPLPCLMRYIRLPYRIYFSTVIRHTFRLPFCPCHPPSTSLYMILVMRLPLPTSTNRCSCIYTTGVCRFPIIHKLTHPIYPMAGRFIATGKHTVRSIVTIRFRQRNGFIHEIFVNRLSIPQLRAVIRPARTFGLKIKAYKVSSNESRFRWTVRMKPHMIQSITTTNTEYTLPGSDIHRSISC